MATVKLTKLQAEEISHKLAIVRDEPDLRDSYDITEAQADAAYEAVPRSGGEFSFDAALADLLQGELENCIDIASANLEIANDSDAAGLRGYISSMKGAQRKIAGAVK